MNKIVLSVFVLSLCILMSCGNNVMKSRSGAKVAYLAAYMRGDDDKQLYYAVSDDGFKFRAINGGKPIVAASFDDKLIRDPMIIKDKKGIYHLVATVSWQNRPFTVWDSKDLIVWENERLIDVAPENASKTWAPEFSYDEENDIYFVHWIAEVNDDWNTACIYYSTTHDFIHFSEPQVLFKDDTGILDANIIKVNGTYNLTYRKNGIWVVSSKSAQGPYSDQYQLTAENVEGPFAFSLNDGSGYGIVWDYFGRSAGFGLWTSPDFKKWTRITNEKHPYYNEQVEFPEKIRHGSIVGLTQQELDKLLKGFNEELQTKR